MNWPLVLLFCDSPGAQWFGKWFANCGADGVRALGGPWDTKEQAQAAILSTGRYSFREGASDHFDPIRPAGVLIRQVGRKCEVWHGDKRLFVGGRVAAKQYAAGYAQTSGLPLFNVKASGAIVGCKP